MPVSCQVRKRRKGVNNTLMFKTNATVCYAEKNMPVCNVSTSDEAADVIHIINTFVSSLCVYASVPYEQ